MKYIAKFIRSTLSKRFMFVSKYIDKKKKEKNTQINSRHSILAISKNVCTVGGLMSNKSSTSKSADPAQVE